MADDRLEQLLRELGSHLDPPEGEGLPEAVSRRVREERLPRRRRPSLTAAVAAALAIAVIAGGAVAMWLIPGVDIQRVPTPPTAPAPGEPEGLDLGRRVSLAQAREAVDINVLIPRRLGPPDGIFVGRRPDGGRVTLVYDPDAELPEDENTGAGMLVTMFRGSTEPDFVRKQVGPQTQVRPITVEGSPGMWIQGAPHTVIYVDEQGTWFDDRLRLAGNVLIWQEGEVTVRLESRLPLNPSLDVAGSMA